jgi:hypothetical protein
MAYQATGWGKYEAKSRSLPRFEGPETVLTATAMSQLTPHTAAPPFFPRFFSGIMKPWDTKQNRAVKELLCAL